MKAFRKLIETESFVDKENEMNVLEQPSRYRYYEHEIITQNKHEWHNSVLHVASIYDVKE